MNPFVTNPGHEFYTFHLKLSLTGNVFLPRGIKNLHKLNIHERLSY